MFYDIYKKLCDEHDEKPYKLPLQLGAKSNSVVAQWQKGGLPRPDMLKKIAEHFNVSVDFLLEKEQKENPAAQMGNGDMSEAKRRLLEAVDDLTDEQCMKLLGIILEAKKII